MVFLLCQESLSLGGQHTHYFFVRSMEFLQRRGKHEFGFVKLFFWIFGFLQNRDWNPPFVRGEYSGIFEGGRTVLLFPVSQKYVLIRLKIR